MSRPNNRDGILDFDPDGSTAAWLADLAEFRRLMRSTREELRHIAQALCIRWEGALGEGPPAPWIRWTGDNAHRLYAESGCGDIATKKTLAAIISEYRVSLRRADREREGRESAI
jgi:hypothetical protein